jgi:hypothetical protein
MSLLLIYGLGGGLTLQGSGGPDPEGPGHEFTATFNSFTNVVPGTSVSRTAQLFGGVSGLPFSVSGMVSSNNGGSTFNSSTKNYVTGQTYIRLTGAAASTYSTTSFIEGLTTWFSGTESEGFDLQVDTKAPPVAPVLEDTFEVEALENDTIINVDLTPTAGSTPFVYAITGGTDSADFTVNSSTGVLSWVTIPESSDIPGENVYEVIVTVSHNDGFSTVSSEALVVVTMESGSVSGFSLPDVVIEPLELSNGEFTSDPEFVMFVDGPATGTGESGITAYHSPLDFVVRLASRDMSLSVNSVTNGTAVAVLSDKFLSITPTAAGTMSISVTATDELDEEITFTYTVNVT